ncbi:nucleoside deaminase [Corynebacterium sp. UBA2622]|uniref:nucleoside deaminase n=1 Tax=Corynebacterium sp. UBA2622 TaxID=1946393 RepID=UPI0025B89808|nr:nucleoside deaminase [Corynebacterium sp. UBA2622]
MDYLTRAIEIAERSARSGGGPFGCVVVTADGDVFEGRNEVVPASDPTAHAEIQALRAACAAAGSPDLAGATVYASAQPCPMCFAALHWANVSGVVYAAAAGQAAAAGFDDSAIADIAAGRAEDTIPFVHDPRGNDNAPFEAWEHNPDRVEY